MTPEEHDERQQTLTLLDQIAEAQRAILTELGCPTDVVAVYAIVTGKQAPPWSPDDDVHNRERAKVAMFVLRFVDRARRALDELDDANAYRAVFWAIQAAAYGGDVVRVAVDAVDALKGRQYLATQAKRAQKGGATRGRQLAEDARKRDAVIRKFARKWRNSDDLQEQFRSAASYVVKKTGLKRRTVERRLEKLRQ